MADTALSPLDQLHADIVDALAELRGARDDYDHCPSQDNRLTVEYAETRLDRLIDRCSVGKREAVKSR